MADDSVSVFKTKVEEFLTKYKDSDLFKKESWDSIPEVISNIGKLSKICIDTIAIVEIASKEVEGLKNSDKLDAACQALDDLIDFPWYLEVADKYLFQILLSFGVTVLDKKFGKEWNLDQLRENLESGKDILETASTIIP